MIPLRDTTPTQTYPIVNYSLIGINVLIFLVQTASDDPWRMTFLYGLVPARYTNPHVAGYFTLGQQLFSFVSYMFLHGGFWHLLSNMWFLYIFGDNIEERLGAIRYLGFYLLCGICSGLFYFFMNWHLDKPIVGASGAIAGVLGAYLILWPRHKILTLIPIIIIPFFVELPAFLFIGLWLFFQIINALGSAAQVSNIAWWAHIGGFIFGIVFLKLFGAFPRLGLSHGIQQATTRKTTHRLQVVHPTVAGDDPDLYGQIEVSPYEAFAGAKKVVNIPWGFHPRLFRITVPPGIGSGSKLRLKGQGREMPDGRRGDLYLEVLVSEKNLQ